MASDVEKDIKETLDDIKSSIDSANENIKKLEKALKRHNDCNKAMYR